MEIHNVLIYVCLIVIIILSYLVYDILKRLAQLESSKDPSEVPLMEKYKSSEINEDPVEVKVENIEKTPVQTRIEIEPHQEENKETSQRTSEFETIDSIIQPELVDSCLEALDEKGIIVEYEDKNGNNSNNGFEVVNVDDNPQNYQKSEQEAATMQESLIADAMENLNPNSVETEVQIHRESTDKNESQDTDNDVKKVKRQVSKIPRIPVLTKK